MIHAHPNHIEMQINAAPEWKKMVKEALSPRAEGLRERPCRSVPKERERLKVGVSWWKLSKKWIGLI